MSQVVQAPFKAVSSLGEAIGLKNTFKTPTPPEAPKSIATDDKAVQTAQAEATARRSRARGFQSTILSQPSGLKDTYGS